MMELKREYIEWLEAKIEAIANGCEEAVQMCEDRLNGIFHQMVDAGLVIK